MALVRLQKFIADAGIASRRKAEVLIAHGYIFVNGEKVTELGTKVDPSKDVVKFKDEIISVSKKKITIVLNKPAGYICSRFIREGKSIYELLGDFDEKLEYAGRLDKDSEGLMIFSNDGDLINKMTHPSFGHKKVYEVLVSGKFSDEVLEKLNGSFDIDGYKTRPAEVTLIAPKGTNTLLKFELGEGRKRQIRGMCRNLGLHVWRLVRVSLNKLELGNLASGQYRILSEDEIKQKLLG